MPTYIHLVRHAQGVHNLCAENHALPDPDLTPLGKEQCAQLAKTFPYQGQLTHLVASPLRRTIYTCLLSFEPALRARDSSLVRRTVVALPDVQEVSASPCDTGSDPSALAAEFGPGGQVDLSLVAPGWNVKTGGSAFAPVMDRLEARARRARAWLRELGRRFEAAHPGRDAHVAVVTHGGFLHFLTQDWDGMNPQAGTGWANTEWRTYVFAEEQGQDGAGGDEGQARLRETDASWRRRRGSAAPLTETEQMELRCAVEGRLREEWGGGGGDGDDDEEEEEKAQKK
ncbi:hypothetical protein MYCTH_2306347 [Thermothelomyces thermophilus ATCC 42464]|uniref:Phosphoglycerate mutase-like protein n=1 Tax=Thermothelomyces thermophilus (strain ATCC 42464 / BCRC 31852 / DSM 1799) TaxID=573729 RepID=G2QHB9_THET4|nr:uncharacterized protein MYCTH_2306347 [Thermothelomyces thermophilus ATCC 42464]AEO58779.1 hypothetical protein MYCTH_2306347 [Thermothelomyces thermophilus ATCC 42464]